MDTRLLEIQDLKVSFKTVRGTVTAVDGVSFHINRGEIVGIVGESGCGKSVTNQAVMRLHDERSTVYEGKILFDGNDILKLRDREMRKIRSERISIIFQDALSALDPCYTIGDQIMEALLLHKEYNKQSAQKEAVELLRLTGIPSPEERVKMYPHELSGGMRQRAMIAMALAGRPELLIADEPTTALDVTIQAQIMELLKSLNSQLNMAIALITHELGIVARTCDRVIVMYLGEVVEEGTVFELFDNPQHPYTIGLLHSVPSLDTDRNKELFMIPGTVPSMKEVGTGCRFCMRCGRATEKCRNEKPEMTIISDTVRVRCFYPGSDDVGFKEEVHTDEE